MTGILQKQYCPAVKLDVRHRKADGEGAWQFYADSDGRGETWGKNGISRL